MKPFIRKKLPFILIAVQVVLIAGLLLYIVPGRYRLYDIVLYDASESVPENPLMGYAPRAEEEENCRDTDLVFILLPFSEWEPQKGIYDKEGVETKYHIEEYKKSGKHAVLRFVCDIPSKKEHRDVPDWLCEISRGVDYNDASGKGYAPDYADETFMAAHRDAIEALASWCRKDDFVSYVEIGSVGQNGVRTQTAQAAADLAPSQALFAQYEAQYAEAFSDDEDLRLLTCADENSGAEGAGSWKDVLGDAQATGQWQIQGLTRETGDEQTFLWTKAPVGGGMAETVPMDQLLLDNLSDTLSQTRSCHLTFIGPGCPDLEQQQTNGSEMIRREMGYCLYLSRLQTTMDFLKDDLQLHFTFNNIGAAPMYWDWPVNMYIYKKKECIRVQTLDLKLSELLPGQEITVTGTVPYSKDLLRGYSVGLSIDSPDGTQHITLAQKGVLPNGEGIHKVYRFKKSR